MRIDPYKADEQGTRLLRELAAQTPVLESLFLETGQINWSQLDKTVHLLSSGERTVMWFAFHLQDRPQAMPKDLQPFSLVSAFTAVSPYWQERMRAAFDASFGD